MSIDTARQAITDAKKNIANAISNINQAMRELHDIDHTLDEFTSLAWERMRLDKIDNKLTEIRNHRHDWE